jgi:hypothetical protein
MVDLPQRLGRRTRSTVQAMVDDVFEKLRFVHKKGPSYLRSFGKKGEHIELETPSL